MLKAKLLAIGNSVGIVIPKEVLLRLNVAKGDQLFLTEAQDGYRVTPYNPDFAEEMILARKVMRQRRDLLHELAK